jgi:hypothetical protein
MKLVYLVQEQDPVMTEAKLARARIDAASC